MANADQRSPYEHPTSATAEEAGFRFECQPGCSACCEEEGEVYLTEEDLVRIAAHLGMSPADFEARYIYRTTSLLRLRKPPGRQCEFHINSRCSIHPVKPTQCRAFPYWPEIIESPETWNEAALRCPGMNKGELIQIETARTIAAEMYRAYPTMYPPNGKEIPESVINDTSL
jgi:Fe-S-cluster containining protein